MIEPMKRYSYFIFEPEYQQFLEQLRQLGVVHIKERTNPKEVEQFAENLRIQQDIRQLQQRLTVIRNGNKLKEGQTAAEIQHVDLPEDTLKDYNLFVSTLSDINDQLTRETSDLANIRNQIQELQVWGDFDLALINKLRASGYYLHFWMVQQSNYDQVWERDYNAQIIEASGRYTYFVTVTQNPSPPSLEDAELQKLPKQSLGELQVQEHEKVNHIQLLKSTLVYLAYHNYVLEEKNVTLLNEYNFNNANLQGSRLYDDKLVILEGWVPEKLAEKMESGLRELDVAFVELELDPTDKRVPVKLKNSRFAKAFEPIVNLFSLPNYNEIDPTPLMAPFFMLFFGMCFGDAGYGLFLLVVASIVKGKVKESYKPFVELFQWLGLAGLVVGFFSGTFFGISLVEVPFLSRIRRFFISSENIMVISLAVGLVQIIYAKYIGAAKKQKQKGLKYALSAYAWPTLILMLVLVFALPMINITLPVWLTYVLYGIAGISVLIALFYNAPGKNIFVNFASGLWETYNTASGLLGDTLSYIRLFAIGLTGSILGGVFNSLAATATEGLPIIAAIPVGLIILVLGHSLNFGLTMISSLVHPLRLTFVEYFNNSDYEGGGKPYEPLRELEVKEK